MTAKTTFVCGACGDKQRRSEPGVSVDDGRYYMNCRPCGDDRLFYANEGKQ